MVPYHPELKFQFPVPLGQHQNSPQFQMVEPNGKAVQILTLAPAPRPRKPPRPWPRSSTRSPRPPARTTVNGSSAGGSQGDQVGLDQQGSPGASRASIASHIIQGRQNASHAPHRPAALAPQYATAPPSSARPRVSAALTRCQQSAQPPVGENPHPHRRAGQTLVQAPAANGGPPSATRNWPSSTA
jgi:hypothetical protein